LTEVSRRRRRSWHPRFTRFRDAATLGHDRAKCCGSWQLRWGVGYRGQRLHCRRLIEHAEHRVRVHCQVDVRVAGEQLGRLRRDAGAGQVRDERLAEGVEVGEVALVVLVRQERRLLAAMAFLGVGTFCNPSGARGREVLLEHLGSPLQRDVYQWPGRVELLLRRDPVLDALGKINANRHHVGSSVLRVTHIDRQGGWGRVEVERVGLPRTNLVPSQAGVARQNVDDHAVWTRETLTTGPLLDRFKQTCEFLGEKRPAHATTINGRILGRRMGQAVIVVAAIASHALRRSRETRGHGREQQHDPSADQRGTDPNT
jgi:hypothetical protein